MDSARIMVLRGCLLLMCLAAVSFPCLGVCKWIGRPQMFRKNESTLAADEPRAGGGMVVRTHCTEHPVPQTMRVVRVIDGDTVVLRLADPPWRLPEPLGDELRLRILGIDAPELRTPRCERERRLAVDARDALQRRCFGAEVSPADGSSTSTSKVVAVRICRWDKYGARMLGDLRLAPNLSSTNDDENYAGAYLLRSGHARVYTGSGERSDWCNDGEPMCRRNRRSD